MKQAKRPAEGEGKMTEIAPDFDAFIHAWAATRIGPLDASAGLATGARFVAH
jgi:hypothetical protein